jgi:hypothetical protein
MLPALVLEALQGKVLQTGTPVKSQTRSTRGKGGKPHRRIDPCQPDWSPQPSKTDTHAPTLRPLRHEESVRVDRCGLLDLA